MFDALIDLYCGALISFGCDPMEAWRRAIEVLERRGEEGFDLGGEG